MTEATARRHIAKLYFREEYTDAMEIAHDYKQMEFYRFISSWAFQGVRLRHCARVRAAKMEARRKENEMNEFEKALKLLNRGVLSLEEAIDHCQNTGCDTPDNIQTLRDEAFAQQEADLEQKMLHGCD